MPSTEINPGGKNSLWDVFTLNMYTHALHQKKSFREPWYWSTKLFQLSKMPHGTYLTFSLSRRHYILSQGEPFSESHLSKGIILTKCLECLSICADELGQASLNMIHCYYLRKTSRSHSLCWYFCSISQSYKSTTTALIFYPSLLIKRGRIWT